MWLQPDLDGESFVVFVADAFSDSLGYLDISDDCFIGLLKIDLLGLTLSKVL